MASPNSSDHSEEGEEDAMAALMGFSTFGNQGPSKKRKFNPKTDAMVDGQDLEVLDKGGKKGQGSGGNQVPLGKMRTLGGGQKNSGEAGWNQDEIMLDDDDEEEGDDDNGMEGGGVALTSQADGDSDSSPGPVYIDTSQRPPIEDTDKSDDEETAEAARIAQAKIDAILANQSTPSMPQLPPTMSISNPVAVPNTSKSQTSSKSKSQSALPGRGMSAYLSALRDVPQPPLPGTGLPPPLTSPVLGITAAKFQNLQSPSNLPPKPQSQNFSHNSRQNDQRGQRNELWYIGYYDRRFNENPWQDLEKKSGLEPVGTWIGRQ